MEEQTSLINISKKEKLERLYTNLGYEKIITHFGNIDSKVIILGIAPMQSHIDSKSNSAFCFDIDLEQTGQKSGAVLIQVFKKLNLKIEDFFWDNLYKIPVEKLTYSNKKTFKEKIEEELDILNIPNIICLGNDSYNEITNLDINVNWNIYKIKHPGFVLRGGMSVHTYIETWRKTLMEIEDGNKNK